MVDQVSSLKSAQIVGVVKSASEKSGIDFDFLLQMAKRESALNPLAKASTSSASGLFQFIDQTWLGTVKKYGEKHGLEKFAAMISTDKNGKHTVQNAEFKKQILDFRFDVKKASALAAELANENKSILEARLGRAVGGTELYAAHFLGPAGAVKLLSAPSSQIASELFPVAAKANKSVFFNDNVPRTVGQVFQSFEKSMSKAAQSTQASIKSLVGSAILEKPGVNVSDLVPFSESRDVDTQMIPWDLFNGGRISAAKNFSPLAMVILQAFDPMDLRRKEQD